MVIRSGNLCFQKMRPSMLHSLIDRSPGSTLIIKFRLVEKIGLLLKVIVEALPWTKRDYMLTTLVLSNRTFHALKFSTYKLSQAWSDLIRSLESDSLIWFLTSSSFSANSTMVHWLKSLKWIESLKSWKSLANLMLLNSDCMAAS